LADIPLSIDADAFRIGVKGKVDSPLSLTLTVLKTGFAPVEVVTVNQCSGNSRGFFEPRVAGGQLANRAKGPDCGKPSGRRHGRHERHLEDLPAQGAAVSERRSAANSSSSCRKSI
jgi:hypothetical protein